METVDTKKRPILSDGRRAYCGPFEATRRPDLTNANAQN